MTTREKFPNRKKSNKERALARQEVASNRTPQNQLARLDDMFGDGKGAKKERAKLATKIENAKKRMEVKVEEEK